MILTLEFVVSGERLTAGSSEAKIARERSSSVSQTLEIKALANMVDLGPLCSFAPDATYTAVSEFAHTI